MSAAGPPRRAPAPGERFLLAIIAAYAAAFSLSGFAHGLYQLRVWGPVAIISACLLIAVAMTANFGGDRTVWVAVGGLAAVVAWSAISIGWSEAIDGGWEDTNRLAFYLAVFATAVAAIRSVRSARVTLGVLGIGTAAIGLYLLLRLATGHGSELFVAFRLSDPVGYINGEAAVLGAGAWLWLSWANGAERIGLRALAMSVTVALAGLALLTQSRGGVLAWVAAAMVAVAIFPQRRRRIWALVVLCAGVAAALPWVLDVYGERNGATIAAAPGSAVTRDAALALTIAAAGAGALYASALALVRRQPATVMRRVSAAGLAGIVLALGIAGGVAVDDPAGRVERSWKEFTALSSDAGDGQRFTTAGGYRYDYWRVAVRGFSSSPLGGLGAGDYPSYYLRERKNPDDVLNAHSLPLQLLAEVGLLGGLALAVFAGAVLFAAVRSRRIADPHLLQCSVAVTGVFVAWLVQSSVDWVATIPGLTGVALIAAAVLLRLPGLSAERLDPTRHSSAAVLVMLLALLMSASVSVHWLADRFRSQAQGLVSRDPVAAISSANRSLSLNPEALPAYFAKSAAYARLDRYRSAVRVLEIASAKEPHAFLPWALMGDLAARSGDSSQARRHYARASRLNPYDKELARLARSGAPGNTDGD